MNDCQMLSPNMKDFSAILEAEAYREKIPLRGVFELTARCNFNCNMCYVHLKEEQIAKIGRELTNEEWLEIARQAKDAGMLYLTLTGGEVFVRPGFKELYIELSKMGFLIQILSNGYLIDETVMEWLKEYPPYSIRFTLYGASNEVYEAVCGIKNGFDRVSHAIDLILEADIPFYMVGTIIKENQYDLQKMYEFAKSKKVYFDHTIAVVQPVRGATADVNKHKISIRDHFEAYPAKVEKTERLFKKVTNVLENCGAYGKSFWITWHGNLQLCAFTVHPAVNVLNQPFIEAWETLLSKLEKIMVPDACSGCKYEGFCKRCPGVLCTECGGYENVTESFCEEAKQLYEIYHTEKEMRDEKEICRTRNCTN